MDSERYGLVDHENWQPFFTFLFFCGVGLILSIPFARHVQDFSKFGYLWSVSASFFFIYVLFLGVLGLNLGATSAARGECGKRMFLYLSGRIFLAQFLSLPFLLFERALHPGKEIALVLIVLYGAIVALLFAGTSRLIEGSTRRGSSQRFILKYFIFALYFFVPLGALPILSPLTGVAALLHGAQVSQLLLIFTFPSLLLLIVVFFLWRNFGKVDNAQTI